jgi:hypothetical protein
MRQNDRLTTPNTTVFSHDSPVPDRQGPERHRRIEIAETRVQHNVAATTAGISHVARPRTRRRLLPTAITQIFDEDLCRKRMTSARRLISTRHAALINTSVTQTDLAGSTRPLRHRRRARRGSTPQEGTQREEHQNPGRVQTPRLRHVQVIIHDRYHLEFTPSCQIFSRPDIGGCKTVPVRVNSPVP